MTILDTPVFTLAPIALWLEDFSEIKKQFELWRAQGIQDLRGYLLEDPSRVIECARKIKILSVNQKTLELYEAQDLQHLISNLEQIFKGDMASTHIDELISLWEGQTEFSSQAVNYSLNGKRLDIQLRGTVVPSHEMTCLWCWSVPKTLPLIPQRAGRQISSIYWLNRALSILPPPCGWKILAGLKAGSISCAIWA